MSEKELLLNMYGDLCKDFAKLDEYFKMFYDKSYCKTPEEYSKKRRDIDIYIDKNVSTLQKKFCEKYFEKANTGYLFDVYYALSDLYKTRYDGVMDGLDSLYGYDYSINWRL